MQRSKFLGAIRPGDAARPAAGGARRAGGLRVVIIALVAALALVASGASAAFGAGQQPAPGPAPAPGDVPGAYAGSYVLFYGGVLAGPIHAFSGCTPDIGVVTYTSTTPTGGTVTTKQFGKTTMEPCQVEVGLGMSSEFRQAIASAVNGKPAMADMAIARVNSTGTATNSELDLTGYIRGLTLRVLTAAGTGWLRLDVASNTLKQVQKTRTLTGLQADDPIDATSGQMTVDLPQNKWSLAGADPITITHKTSQQKSCNATGKCVIQTTPGAVDVPKFQVRIPETAGDLNSFTLWLNESIDGQPSSIKTVSVSYADAARNRSFQVTVTGPAIHFDPYPYTGTQRLLGIGEQTVNVSWPTTTTY